MIARLDGVQSVYEEPQGEFHITWLGTEQALRAALERLALEQGVTLRQLSPLTPAGP